MGGEAGEAQGRYRVSVDGPEALESEGNVRFRVSTEGSEAEAAEDWAAEQEAINEEASLNGRRGLPGGAPTQDPGAAAAPSPPIEGSSAGQAGDIPSPHAPHDEIPMPEVPHHEIPAPETLHDQSPPPATPFDDGMPQHSGGMSLPA